MNFLSYVIFHYKNIYFPSSLLVTFLPFQISTSIYSDFYFRDPVLQTEWKKISNKDKENEGKGGSDR